MGTFTKTLSVVALCMSLGVHEVAAAEPAGLDLALKMGAMAGEIGSDEANDGNDKIIGGVVFAGSFFFDHSSWLTTMIEPQIVVDIKGISVLKKGASTSLLYHLSGGPRAISQAMPLGEVSTKSFHNVSIMTRIGYYAYTARDITNRSEPVTGATAEIFMGFNAGVNTTEQTAFGIEFGRSAVSVATSIERVRSRYAEISLYTRITI